MKYCMFVLHLCSPFLFSRSAHYNNIFSSARSCRAVKANDSQCRSRNCPGFDPSILRHSGIWGAANEAELNIVYKKKKKSPKNSPLNFFITDQAMHEKILPTQISMFRWNPEMTQIPASKHGNRSGKESWENYSNLAQIYGDIRRIEENNRMLCSHFES